MRLAGHRAFQFGIFVAVLVAIVQLALNRVDLFLLIGEGFASVVNEYGLSSVSRQVSLGLRNLAIEIESTLLQLLRRPFFERRIRRRVRTGPRCLRANWLAIAGRALAVNRTGHEGRNRNCQ